MDLNYRFNRKLIAKRKRMVELERPDYSVFDETLEQRLDKLKAQTMSGELTDFSITPYCKMCGGLVRGLNNYSCEWVFMHEAICVKCNKKREVIERKERKILGFI